MVLPSQRSWELALMLQLAAWATSVTPVPLPSFPRKSVVGVPPRGAVIWMAKLAGAGAQGEADAVRL